MVLPPPIISIIQLAMIGPDLRWFVEVCGDIDKDIRDTKSGTITLSAINRLTMGDAAAAFTYLTKQLMELLSVFADEFEAEGKQGYADGCRHPKPSYFSRYPTEMFTAIVMGIEEVATQFHQKQQSHPLTD